MKNIQSNKRHSAMPEYTEPYVGMPVYLDDEFFNMHGDEVKEEKNYLHQELDEVYPNQEVDYDDDWRSEFDEYYPVGMAYVPWQGWEEPYAPEKALMVGTAFPCLDLPFMGGGKR